MRKLLIISVFITGSFGMAAEPVSDDSIDVVFLDAKRPYRIRLQVQFDGKSYVERWHGIVDSLFHYLDANGDGALSPEELSAAPNSDQFRLLVEGGVELEAGPPPEPGELAIAGTRRFNIEHLRSYYRRAGVGPFQLRWYDRTAGTPAMDRAIFSLLGAKEDTPLTKELLAKAADSMRARDLDNDEMIHRFELVEGNIQPEIWTPRLRPSADSRFDTFDPSTKGRQILAQRLLVHYDRNKDGKLSSTEFGIPPAQFALLDTNRSGMLDGATLEKWPSLPADAEIAVQMDRKAEGDRVKQLRTTLPSHSTRIGSIRLQLPEDEIEVIRATVSESPQVRRRPGMMSFESIDRNRDGVLDHQEIFQPPFQFVPMLRIADRNRDEKLSRKEFDDFSSLQARLRTHLTTITLVQRGSSLWDLLDVDHDSRLGRRELRNAWNRVSPWMGNAGRMDAVRLPSQYQLLLSDGPIETPNGDPGKCRHVQHVGPIRSPVWFQKMDRNADGDLSPSEFLGTAEQFRKLDRDGDGLIDPVEATKFDKK